MRKALWTTLAVVSTGVTLYTLAGFFLAPRLVDRWIEATVATNDGRRLEIERVTVNPFTFETSFSNVTLVRPENLALVSIARIGARLDIESFVRREWIFRDAVRLFDVRLTVPPDGEPMFFARVVEGTGVVVDTARGSASVNRLHIEAPAIRLTRQPGGGLDLPSWIVSLLLGTDGDAVTFGTLEASGGRVTLVDDTVSPAVRLVAEPAGAGLTHRGRDAVRTASVHGQLASGGGAEFSVEWQPDRRGTLIDLQFALRDIDISEWSPYVARATGHTLTSGRLDLSFHLRRSGGVVDIETRLAGDDLRLGERADAAATQTLPLERAIALLQDEDGRVLVETAERRDADGSQPLDVTGIFAQTLRAYVIRTVTAPFATLAPLAGRPDEDLRRLDFLPGSAEITPPTAERLDALGTALQRRPLLGIVVRPAYRPLADREALARQQIRLHVILATSARPPEGGDDVPIDFDDPKVRGILDEFAATRLGNARRAALDRNHPERDGAYYGAVFEALVEDHEVTDSTLRRLARFRVRSIVSELEKRGIEARRLRAAEEFDVQRGGRLAVSVNLDVQPASAFERAE